MTRIITAMFDDRQAAERAVDSVVRELNVSRDHVRIHAADMAGYGGAAGTGAPTGSAAHTDEDRGFWASLKDLFVTEEDRYTYAEGIRRGSVVVSATLEDSQADAAMDVLEAHGAIDLDTRENEWREAGWAAPTAGTTGGTVTSLPTQPETGVVAGTAAPGTGGGYASTPAVPPGDRPSVPNGQTEVIPLAEERLRVGKRDVERGRVRVRSYVVETPVQEEIRLRTENVEVERRPTDRPAGANPFEERTIEAVERGEEPVVSKEAKVTEEVVLRKQEVERTETVRDTVRHTEVDVDDTAERQKGAQPGKTDSGKPRR